MGFPSPTVTTGVRKVRVQAITGPIRAMNAVGGTRLAFQLLECTVDGRKSDGRDLTADEARQIQWLAREATGKPWGKSYKLVPGRELATGSGKTFEYTSHLPANHALVVQAYVGSPSDDVAHWVKLSTNPNFRPSGGNHSAITLKYPEIKDPKRLEEPFKSHWDAFQAALEAAGARVVVGSTLRSLGRAYMMHYCGLVANDKIKPWEVPDEVVGECERAAPEIEWTHLDSNGRVDLEKSKRAARDMMRVFEIAHPAALFSNHTRGLAIDATIRWAGTLKIKDKTGKVHEITTTPRHGGLPGEAAGNAELRKVAETYGVRKLLNDPPHWSIDGH